MHWLSFGALYEFNDQSSNMTWTATKYSNAEVDKAGTALASNNASRTDYEIIDNWRSAHNFPLNTFQNGLRNMAKTIEGNCIIAQRIKRLASITDKLKRYPTTRLSQMQDIGGCRAVMYDVERVNKLFASYKSSDFPHKFYSEKNYIEKPKPSGYRGIHLIYKYAGRKTEYHDLKIEIQLRSLNQHAWATAVETVDLFTRQALKSNKGHRNWLRFFALMGNAIAYREDGNPVPNTPTFEDSLRENLNDYVEELDVHDQLRGYEHTLRELRNYELRNDHYYLLVIDPYAKELEVYGYPESQLTKASRHYSEIEQEIRGGSKNAVLVSVDSVAELKKAYPNYFLDTSMFLELVEWAIR
jgi:ppGpp synthetase/RelA/SpoT-type nucleotidyltranferase